MIFNSNITIVLDSFEIGGAERQALLLADELKERGYEVHFISLTSSGIATERLEELEVTYEHMDLTYSYGKIAMIRNIRAVKKTIKKSDAGIVIPFTYWPNVLAGNAWVGAGAEKGFWNQRDEGLHMFGTYFEKRAIKRASAIIANSPSGRKALVEKLNVPEEKVHIVPNGIKLAPVKKHWKDIREELHLDEDRLSAVMVANLHEKKDHHTMLLAWREVINAMPIEKPVLMLAGRFAGMQDKIKAHAKELGIEEEIFLLGAVDDIRGILTANDILVHSSKSEGCPNSILEAMSAQMGVVATDIPGIRMAVGEDYEWLAPPDDYMVFAKKIIAMLNNTGARQEAGMKNQKRVQAEFTPRKMVDRYLQLIHN